MVRGRAFLAAVALAAIAAMLWALRPAGFAFTDLWLTPDQQGRWHVEHGDPARAARHFADPMWKGVACYRARHLECAAESFALAGNAEGDYNLGVVRAREGDLAAALAAFESALRARPGWREALANRDLVARLIAESRAKKPGEDAGEPVDDPDDMRVDELGKRGKRGAIEIEKLGPDAIDKLWLRNVRTDPALFLKSRFAAETQARVEAVPRK